jgi:transposase
MPTTKDTSFPKSVYRNQNAIIRAIFERAKTPQKVLCVALDYAKSKHVALCCDGNGDILKKPFPVDNTAEGVDFLCAQIDATARRRKIVKKNIFLGGEDEPAYIANFAAALRERGYLVVRVSAREAEKNRENLIASTDDLDLLGIAKTLLSRRARVVELGATDGKGNAADSEAAVYRRIRELSRARRGLVRQQTAAAKRIHALADQLFPGFLNHSKSGITPFTEASLELMRERFSAPEIGRRKPTTLANFLRSHRSHHPDETAAKLIELARNTLPPQAARVPALQKTLAATIDLHICLERNAKSLRIDAAHELASTPYALATSIRGIGFVLAAGAAGELGEPALLGNTDSLCAYSGIVPRIAQSGGPDLPARHGSTARVLKDWVAQSAQKIALYGPPELKDRMTRWKVNGQHAVFAGAKRYLRLLRCIVRNEVPYLSPAGRRPGATQQESAEACLEAWKILIEKWRKIPDWCEVAFADDKPIGFWRRVAMDVHKIDLPFERER